MDGTVTAINRVHVTGKTAGKLVVNLGNSNWIKLKELIGE